MRIRRFQSYSDDQLVELIRRDDRTAFNELYQRYWSDLFMRAFNIAGDKEASSDICQEVFIWFWENRGQINIISSVKGYLFSAVKYKITNYIRNDKVRDDFFDKLKQAPEDYIVEESLELKELEAIIREFTDTLPERCAEVFKLSRYEYFSNREIASQLNIS